MRITNLNVDGFGVWNSLELSDLSEISVFYGPNEAGKTTLMQFVRSLLYGFSPERRARYLPPLGGGRPGGTMLVADGPDAYAISRHADLTGDGGEIARVADGKSGAADDGALGRLLGDVDEPTFNNVFAFGLREIQELATLSDTQAASELYGLALGLDRVSLVDVLSELESSRNRILAADDRPSLVTQLLGQRERLRDEIADLGQATVRYLALSTERKSLDGEVARLEEDHARLDKQAREVALARVLQDRWRRRAAIDVQLQGMGSFDALGENALARYERLGARIAARRRRFARLARKRKSLRGEIGQLAINETLFRQAPRLEALAEQQQWIRSLELQIKSLEEDVLNLEVRRDGSAPRGGGGAQSTNPQTAPLSPRAMSELRVAAKAVGQARRDIRELKSRTATSAETSAGLLRQVEAAAGRTGQKGLTQALAEAGELVSQLRKRVQLDERLDQLSRRETQLEEQGQDHLDNQILPSWALAGLGALFVLGCALVLLFVAGLVLPASLSGALGWPVGLVGVLAAGAAGAIKFGMEQSASSQLDTCHQQIASLKEQAKEARAERDLLDQRLPKGGGPLVARLQTAEKALARLEELLPLDAQREAAERAADAAAKHAEAAQEALRAARKKWQRMLAAFGLPPKSRPRELRLVSRQREQWRELNKQLELRQGELGRQRAEFDTLAGRIRQLVTQVGVVPRSQLPLEQLAQCLGELNEQQKLIKHREQLSAESRGLRGKQTKLVREANRMRKRRRRLLDAAGVRDEAQFRRRATAQAEAQRLRAERATLADEITLALAPVCSEEQLSTWLSGERNLEPLETEMTESRRAARERWNATVERRGEMNEQLKTLVENRQLGHLRVELGIVEKRLQDALDRWRVLTTCGMMLAAVREYYEREHQPQALRDASVYLQRLTGGRYTRVWTPLGKHCLNVDDAQGASLGVELLSSGTREQLFLALRLALVAAYARRGIVLPLVLDDVLVNFDVVRAKAAAMVLRDFARQGCQVLVFTCHEHISKLFKNIKADVRQLPDRMQMSTSDDGASARRARRSRIEVSPEPLPVAEPVIELEEIEAEIDVQEIAAPEVETILPEPPAQVAPVAEHPLPPIAPVAPPASPPRRTASRPVPRPRGRRDHWSAEEFEGELTDRVRSGAEPWQRESQIDPDEDFAATEDSEAA